ncbi:LysR family transcriptional regulator [Roseospira goensis]|uniref:DNA-binding transcriptional LysR family regulator n=1 Tax=Roseospira goensis TaxID=391922 RepID=A0A7W6WJS1_9PROT|nr:LysR family transcriptional regulator [Roseospira goensis]MBB4284788.1 DNA-binding transcriptional LysR family regulator [Roseospira goensis]
MDTDLLRAFVAVAEHGGFSAAARALHRTQSAVSLQIRRLEEHLGVPVFSRTSRRVSLTEAGGRVLPHARQMLVLQEQALAAAADTRRRRPLRIGLTDEQAEAFLPRALPAFTAAYPDVPVAVTCGLSPLLIDMVAGGRLDLALTVRHHPTPTGAVLADEALVWVAGETWRPTPGAPVPLALNPEGCVYRAQALAVLSGLGRGWRIAYTSQSPTGINVAVRLGLGVTVKARRSVPDGCRILERSEGFPALAPAQVELHRAPAQFDPAMQAMVDILCGQATGDSAIAPTPQP